MQLYQEAGLLNADKQGAGVYGVQLDQEGRHSLAGLERSLWEVNI